MAYLQMVSGQQRGRIEEIEKDYTIIGRVKEKCDIVLNLDGISRQHASIRKVDSTYYLMDLESKNETFLNDVKLTPRDEYALKPGDRVMICDVEFLFHASHPVNDPKSMLRSNVISVVEGTVSDDTKMQVLDASRSSALTSASRSEIKLKAMLEIARELSTDLRIDVVAPKILDCLVELFPQAERLFLILADPATKLLVRKAFKYRPRKGAAFDGSVPESQIPMSISRSIVDDVLGKKQAILSEDALNDSMLARGGSVAGLEIRSVMCVPLLTPDGQALGILQVDTRDRKQFKQEDLDLLLALASQFAIAVQYSRMHENLIERERVELDLEQAKEIHRLFLPKSVPDLPGYEFFAFYLPAYAIGGDFYDFVELPNNRLALALGDVSGKGIAAALMMAKFSGSTRQCFLTKNEPGPAAEALNNMVCDAAIDERFITMCLGVLDVDSRELTLASAGHPSALIRRADGTVEEVGDDFGGLFLGFSHHTAYDEGKVDLNPGDVVVIYSDGVSEAARKTNTPVPTTEFYDTTSNRRLLTRVAQTTGGPASVGRAILQDIRDFTAGQPQSDDITLICFGPTS